MLQITREAIQYLLRARKERGLDTDAGARLLPTSAGIGLTFASSPEPGDKVVDCGGVPIYVAGVIAAALDRSIIDVRADNGQPRLAVRPQGGAG